MEQTSAVGLAVSDLSRIMATNCSNCGVCENLQINKHSVVWCSDCDEGLCEECKNHHAVSKASKSQETVYIAEYKKLPTEVIHIAQTCKLHNEKFELFCRDHDCPCCKKCVNSHNDCKSLTDINELIKNIKTSNAFYEFEQNLLEVVENIKRLSTNRKENLTLLENKKREIEAEIKQTRIHVNHHLDKLQDDLIEKLVRVEQKENSKIEKLLTTLKKKESDIIEVQENIASIKQHAPELQTFLTMKNIEKDIAAEETFIQSITTSGSTNQVNISFQINKSLQQISAIVQKFGEIIVSSDPCDFSIQKRKDRQAQIMLAFPTRNIDNLTLKLQKRINTAGLSNVHSCALLPGDRMVFSCTKQHKIKVFKSDGSKDFQIKKIGPTFNVVFIGDDSIAVTSGYTYQINIIDLKKHKLKKSIQVDSYNSGVVYKDGHLIYCAGSKGLQTISLNDETITNVSNSELRDYAYVTALGDKLFYTDYRNHSVTCCDYHGNILWTFYDPSVLMSPLGISVDNDGNVYVAGNYTNNVVIISPDGQRYRQLLSSDDGLRNPWSLDYDKSTNELLVANRFNEAFLFDIK
ncbi:unnamed protein product [Mytilus coruscus]|uniref:B box-type domain-containing protein n=1 Tax=Mytilus coruscus TaxID=42192 RepID=A0A6J8BRL9_MYTCO|nr:unnamed protein product [Mytilus coruscus]